jgi:hypothetical protein
MRRRAIAAILAGIACACTPPGKGAKAEAGYNNARPVIAALESYHQKHNEYPPALRNLAPDDLAQSAWKTSEGKPVDEFFEYEKSGASYRLQFRYTGPGTNRCVYTPEAAKWDCAGAY